MSDLTAELLGSVAVGAAIASIAPITGAISKGRARKRKAGRRDRDRKEARWRELYDAFTADLRSAADITGHNRRALRSQGTAQFANSGVLRQRLDGLCVTGGRVQVDGSPEAQLIATGVLDDTRDVRQMLMLGQAFDRALLDRLYDVLLEAETAMIKLSRKDFGAEAG
jgi:hypothetical protein